MGKLSREKGKRGEREVARVLKTFGFPAWRSVQYCGSTGEAADVVGLDGFHLEVKRCELLRIAEWLRQAERDCGGDIPVVCHRRSNERWYATLPMDELFGLVAGFKGIAEQDAELKSGVKNGEA